MAAPIKRPHRHRVAGETLPITWHPVDSIEHEGSKCFGLTDPNTNEIKVDDSLSPFKVRDTLIHELIHVLIDKSGMELDDEIEEKVCKYLGTALAGHIQDNPTFWKFISKRVPEDPQV